MYGIDTLTLTIIGMVVMVSGIGAFCIGWSMKPKQGILLLVGLLMMLGGMFIGIGANPAKDMPHGSPGMVMFGLIMTVIGVGLTVVQIVNFSKASRQKAVQMAEDKKIAFYKECASNGIKECKTEKEIQKITLIAQKHNMQYSDLATLFYDAKASVEKDTANKEEAALNAKKEEERKQYNLLNRFSELKGRDKRIAILTSEREEALQSAKTLRAGASALMSASQQKEHDWAIHGGIASGIAGPAAGLATAVDIQAKNAKIRAQNEANIKAFAPVVMTSYSGAANHEKRAQSLLEEIEKTKTKLVANDDAQTCLSRISLANAKVEVSETGTCMVTATAKLKAPVTIYDDVDAIIDGTIIAKIYDQKSLVGTAQLVLPKYGVSKYETSLKGMCLFCGTPNKNYSVEYAATNLWAMER